MKSKYSYIYGPVHSWRLGNSLGIDPISTDQKICNFDCIYCQLGKTVRFENKRKVFVPTEKLLEEIKSLPAAKMDYLTFSGRGEPTLAKNLGEMIKAVKEIRKEKIAVITNSSLMYLSDVRNDLLAADFVLAKLDACSQETLETVNGAMEEARFNLIIDGIKDFKALFRGKLALQIMFIHKNEKFAREIAKIAAAISPDEVQLDTPLRPSAVKPLSKKDMDALKVYFEGLPVVMVYEGEKKEIQPFDEKATAKRHGNYRSRNKTIDLRRF